MILVTGGTGFLGSELIKQLIEGGKSVRAIKRETSVIPDMLLDFKIEWVTADILDYFALEKAFKGITRVYHCAAMVSFDPAYKKQILKVNQEGTSHIVNLCLEYHIEKLIHVSSVAALGEAKKGALISEETHWEFNGQQHSYSISKYESEMEVWRGIAEGLNAVIVNPSLVIGANSGNKGTGQIFHTVKRGLSFYTKGSMGLVDVEDVARAAILLMETSISGQRFLLNAENVTTKELLSATAISLGLPPPTKEAQPWLMELGWRGARLLSLFTGKDYALTKDSARASIKQHKYENEKFLKAFQDFKYKPVVKTIEEICSKLKR